LPHLLKISVKPYLATVWKGIFGCYGCWIGLLLFEVFMAKRADIVSESMLRIMAEKMDMEQLHEMVKECEKQNAPFTHIFTDEIERREEDGKSKN
jgi:hypothetical protein